MSDFPELCLFDEIESVASAPKNIEDLDEFAAYTKDQFNDTWDYYKDEGIDYDHVNSSWGHQGVSWKSPYHLASSGRRVISLPHGSQRDSWDPMLSQGDAFECQPRLCYYDSEDSDLGSRIIEAPFLTPDTSDLDSDEEQLCLNELSVNSSSSCDLSEMHIIYKASSVPDIIMDVPSPVSSAIDTRLRCSTMEFPQEDEEEDEPVSSKYSAFRLAPPPSPKRLENTHEFKGTRSTIFCFPSRLHARDSSSRRPLVDFPSFKLRQSFRTRNVFPRHTSTKSMPIKFSFKGSLNNLQQKNRRLSKLSTRNRQRFASTKHHVAGLRRMD